MAAYFGDLGDGVHKGDENDPRVSVIQVIPDEIRYWIATKGTIARAVDQTISSFTKGTAVLGELRTINKAEVRSVVDYTAANGEVDPAHPRIAYKVV